MEYIVFLHEEQIAKGSVDIIVKQIDDLITEYGYKKSRFSIYEYENHEDDYSYYCENGDKLTFADIL